MRRRPRKRGRGPREGGADEISDGVFTPLIDIFIAIVFFLMVGMTTGGEFVSVSPGLELPQSTGDPASQELIVAVSLDRIFLSGDPVMGVDEAMTSADASEPYLIPELYELLEGVRSEVEGSIRDGEAFRGIVAIQGDRRIPYAVLSRILYSARKAGYTAFNLHVTTENGSTAPSSNDGS